MTKNTVKVGEGGRDGSSGYPRVIAGCREDTADHRSPPSTADDSNPLGPVARAGQGTASVSPPPHFSLGGGGGG